MVEILFWIKSRRGTNEKAVYKYNKKPSNDIIKEDLEEWCSKFGAWNVSDDTIIYGYEILPKIDSITLKKRWHNICDKKEKVDEQYMVLRARMLSKERKI